MCRRRGPSRPRCWKGWKMGFVVRSTRAMFMLRPCAVRPEMRGKSRDPGEARWEPTALDALRKEMSAAFVDAARALAAEGFVAAAHLTRKAEWFNADSYVSIWTNRAAGNTAQVV